MIFVKFPPLFCQLTKCCPATTFDTVSCLRSHAIAIHENSTFATSQNAAPATRLQSAAAQSAAPATKKQRASIDTLLKYCACQAKRKNDLPACEFEVPKGAFRARLPPFLTLWSWKLTISCGFFYIKLLVKKLKEYDFLEASVTFHASHTVRPLPLFLTPCYVCAALPLWFMTTQHLRHVTKCCACHEIAKCSSTRENDTLVSTRFQSHAKRKRHRNVSISQTQQNTLYLRRDGPRAHLPEHIFCAPPNGEASRPHCEHPADGCGRGNNAGRTRLQPPDLQG